MTSRSELVEHELEILYLVSNVLNSSVDLHSKLNNILEILHVDFHMLSGMITLRTTENDSLSICEVYSTDVDKSVRYQIGEGLVGAILDAGSTIVVERLADEPRFISRLGLYNSELSFIGAPILVDKTEVVGVLTIQPHNKEFLGEKARFLEMVANLIAQSVKTLHINERKQQDLLDERDNLRQALVKNYRFENIIGHSEPMLKVFDIIRQVSKWNTTVLIRGESGTGKEVVANSIHFNSSCSQGTFVKLNCAALPDNLLESELFGHEKGAFTGAINQRKGRFELADNGTIFLDEIGEISASFQAKLLRILQEGEFERVGGTKTITVNVRIVAATNRNLEQDVADGLFREDLYYRLNVMPINMPALRDRLEDIPDLADFLLKRLSKQQGGRPLVLKESALRIYMKYSWPGNVRELENRLERAAIMSNNGVIDRDVVISTGLDDGSVMSPTPQHTIKVDFHDENLDEREKVIAALEQTGWVQAKAARLLNMTPRQIAYRIQTLEINVKQM
ncbi:nif-specific transcriptional activator NifA [Methyloprofundus sedimenti]|uniref:Nif-specific regulatory protein n=1 Tax=Methyloprofundus sedimenti TaxID=1420851 RepID=A0A1V8M1T6_9GAMM|nr:nif-specific transcriptional activator NifA [Methyloprofundus sedimenti]OQK15520.1 nif-specific transcriptional activator NifA [Methyloprofundus sedimenti]